MEFSTETKIEPSDFFIKSTYTDPTGRTLPCYLCTRKGCEMIANKLTGKKGVIFTALYINAFHEMEEQIKKTKQIKVVRCSSYNVKQLDNKIQTFRHEEFGKIRTIEIDGATWFCGRDVAKALGYKDTVNALKAHCKKRGVVNRHLPHPQSPTKQIEMTFINEPNLYRLATQSKLEGAERFEGWVFEEVLPTIRKTGGYGNASLTPQQRDEIRIMMKEAVETALSERDKETVMKLIPFFESLNRNIIRAINDNMKLLAVYIKWLIKKF
ncbi:MAG: Rha family transcriptional regulator [Ruminococcus flavefaciens]|nr:Rha family transcriptional regulator [Ruminococcus flavefaciens]